MLKPWLKQEWCIVTVSAEFVWRMEDVWDLCAEPYDPQYRVVCCDESSSQLVSQVRQPLLVAPRQPVRYDDEYRWEGTCHVFMFVQPLGGWRHVKVPDRRRGRGCRPR